MEFDRIVTWSDDRFEPSLTDAVRRTKVRKAVRLKVAGEFTMSVLEMYHDFRRRFPEMAQAADTRHANIWDSVDDETVHSWFESLADAINDQISAAEKDTDLHSVFSFFDKQLQSSNIEVKNCIDVSFVENLFWEVLPSAAANAWDAMPNSMQQMYLKFHGQPPTTK